MGSPSAAVSSLETSELGSDAMAFLPMAGVELTEGSGLAF